MMRSAFGLRRALGALALACAWAAGPAAALQPEQLSRALAAVQTGDFDTAQAAARAAADPIAEDIVAWHRLRAGQGGWSDYAAFLTRNADWPGLRLMRRRAERVMPRTLPGDQVRAFFSVTPPQTGRGALLYAAALEPDAAKAARARAWTTLTMTRADRALFLERFGAELKPLHVKRLDHLLWEGQTGAAEEMLALVPPGEAALARARIALQEGRPGVDTLIAAVPAAQAGDAGLAHDRFDWRMTRDRYDPSEDLLQERSTSAAALGRPEVWASRRRLLARRALREGRPRTAYAIASRHQLSEGSHYSDLEWLSGYIALKHMEDPDRALAHFQAFQAAVETPISLGRAGYWLGQAYELAGDRASADAAYRAGAQHQTSFYGQLSAVRAGAGSDGALVTTALPSWRNRAFANGGPVRAALALEAAKDRLTALRFLLHVQENLGPEDSAALAALALEMGQAPAAVRMAKRVARGGPVWHAAYYPVSDTVRRATNGVDPALALAVARQESELNPVAISPAGARGIMQLMPGTARAVSADLGLTYDAGRLLSDPAYNVRLGSAYLAEMLERYGGSVVLAAAAYNAGPHRVDQWIARYGDPRAPGIDAVDWIEGIPFRETRNYVMRVIEGVYVYRSRLAGRAGPVDIEATLGAR